MELSSVDLSWLPSDADEQLALGFRIISNAYKTRVTSLEAEIRSVRAAAAEKAEQLASFQKKFSSMEVQLIECTQRGNQLAEENRNLITTVKKLQRDIDRLESLKRAVLHSIQEDRGDADGEHRYYTTDDMLHSAAPRTMLASKTMQTQQLPIPQLLSSNKEAVDGRNFLKIAKATLQQDEVAELVGIIRRFNCQQLPRDDAIAQGHQVIGDGNQQLIDEFKRLFRV
ncbi:hypothetical protein BgAZ_101450 [Babesia gibsoni]|uniref:At4g15545-like C-terminal domain-containing protein n=1 Tax=Babesia gibsoni TaxID=33632 RepID=A0AAD8UVB3_BABGI|nr:hypothetical protein BgAZ_101450 [Babesia gibsoni]